MTDVKSAAVRLDLINAQFKGGLKESAGAVDGFSKNTTLGLAAAGTAAVAFAKHSTDAYVTYGKEMMKLSRISGENIETSSKLNFAAQMSNVSTDQLTTGIKFLEKSMAAGRSEFGKLGVTVVDSNGHLRSTHSVLLDTADALSKMTDAGARTDYITKIFGRSGLALGPMLAKGSAGIRQLEEDTAKYGLVLTQDNLPAIQENIKAHREFEAASKGLTMAVGQYMLPAFTSLEHGLAAIPGPLMGILPVATAAVAGLSGVVVVGSKIVTAGQKLGEVIPDMSSKVAAGAVVVGGAAAAYEIWNHRMQDAYANAAKLGDVVTKGNMTGGFDSLGRRIQNIDDQIIMLNGDIAASSSPFDADARAEWEAYVTQIEKSKAATQAQINTINALSGATGDDVSVVKAWINSEAQAGRTYDTTGLALQAYTGKIDANTIGTEEGTKAVEAMTAATNEKNKAEQDAVGSQISLLEASNKAGDSQRAVETAQRGVTDAWRAVTDAQNKANEADRAAVDSARKVADALGDQKQAEQELADARKGMNDDESMGEEAAKIARDEAIRRNSPAVRGLEDEAAAIAREEARRRALPGGDKADTSDLDRRKRDIEAKRALLTNDDLEARKRDLDVRRAEQSLLKAEQAPLDRVTAAEKKVADSVKAVADARGQQVQANQAAVDAHRVVGDAAYKVRDAENAVRDANINVIKSAGDLDVAINNNALMFGTNAASIEKNKEMLDDWVRRGLITQDQADRMSASMLFLKWATDQATAALRSQTNGSSATDVLQQRATTSDPGAVIQQAFDVLHGIHAKNSADRTAQISRSPGAGSVQSNSFTIVQQPGESADQLADRIIRRMRAT